MDEMEQEALAVITKIKGILTPNIIDKHEGWKPWCEGFISALTDFEVINEGEHDKLLDWIRLHSSYNIKTVGKMFEVLSNFDKEAELTLGSEGGMYPLPSKAVALLDEREPSGTVIIFV